MASLACLAFLGSFGRVQRASAQPSSVVEPPVASSARPASPALPAPPPVVASVAEAREGPTFDVPEGCPSRTEFVARVQRPTTNARFDVRVERVAPQLYRGRIDVAFPNEPSSERAIDAPSCDEVLTALALVASLAADAHASGELDPLHQKPPETPAPAPPPPQAVPSTTAPDTVPPPRRTVHRFAAGARATLAGGFAPGPMTLGEIFGEIHGNDGAPIARLALASSVAAVEESAGTGVASFRFLGGTADVCPLTFGSPELSLGFCGRGELGSLRSEGSNIDPARSSADPWVAVGVAARGRFALSSRFFVDFEATPRVPFTRPRFLFYPDQTEIFRVPAITWATSLALGVGFP